MNLKQKFRLYVREISVFYVYLREGFVEVWIVVCWEYVWVFFIQGEVDFFFFFFGGCVFGVIQNIIDVWSDFYYDFWDFFIIEFFFWVLLMRFFQFFVLVIKNVDDCEDDCGD